jgi:predicted permease
MRLGAHLHSWLHATLHRSRIEREMENELRFHIERYRDDLMRGGLSIQEATRRAQAEFGAIEARKEECREALGVHLFDELRADLRYALRMLRKSPALTTVAILSLALGIGANTIIFSAVNHVLLHSLPYQQPARLFALWSRSASHGAEPMHVSAADFYDWRAQSHAFESLAAYASWPMNLTNVDEPRRLETELVSASLFSTLGVNAQIGRTFLADEDQAHSPFVVVISHHLWREMGESARIVGSTVTLNGSLATVIGVMPPDFAFPTPDVDAWVPLSLGSENRANREGRWLAVIGRLRANINRRDAAAEMDVIASRLAAAYPATNSRWSASLVPLQDQVVGKTRPILLTLQAGAVLLLLISCANLANLLLAKGVSRAREIGIRAALGASRGRILRQLIVESSALAVVGGGMGLLLSLQGVGLVRTFGEGLIPRAGEIHLSGPVALFAVIITLLTVVIFGLVPAIHASRVDLREQISSGGRATPRNIERKRGLLVAIEVGLASVLLIGAGLLGESLVHLLSTAPGLRTDHLLSLRLTLSRSHYRTNAEQNAFFDQILRHVKDLPGVLAVGEISDTPLEGNNPTFEFDLEGAIHGASDAPIQAGLRAISVGYLEAVGIPLLNGRYFTLDDRTGGAPVALVNQTMARRYWPISNPVGRRLRLKEDRRWITVAGVVPDIKHMGLKTDEGPVVYIPYAQKTQDWLAWTTLLVRTAGDPMDFVRAVRGAIRSLDKNQPVADVGTLDQVLTRLIAMPRFTTVVIATVSGFALLIAVIGVYGLLAYTVARRTPELAVRQALGASSIRLVCLLLRQAMFRVLTGLAGGLICAWLLAQWLQSLLFGVRPHDLLTFARVAGLFVLVSLAAVLAPALRATKIDPTTALRAD